MLDLLEPHRRAVERLHDSLPLSEVNWALTGSVSHRLQGADIDCHDVDVQTDEPGAYEAARRLRAWIVEPVRLRESVSLRSHLGRVRFEDLAVDVELMGALQKRASGQEWSPPTDPAQHRRFVVLGRRRIPVLSLTYEADAYAAIGRDERAALLRRVDHGE